MKEFIDKLIERLEEKAFIDYDEYYTDGGECLISISDVKEIANELAEEYRQDLDKNSQGWIPCSERLPHTNDAVNITWINRKPEPYYEDIKDKPFTATGHYHNGKWYWFSSVCKDYLDEYGDSEFDRIDKDIEIEAWCELPAPYTEGE